MQYHLAYQVRAKSLAQPHRPLETSKRPPVRLVSSSELIVRLPGMEPPPPPMFLPVPCRWQSLHRNDAMWNAGFGTVMAETRRRAMA